ncbi:MAG: hypothetical protein GY795_43265, partial [Desulfobacterales bacterium]|nr:hypothetical protein [Desulfobacterales bacterium]
MKNSIRKDLIILVIFIKALPEIKYPLEYEEQGILYFFKKHKLLFLGLNSCFEIDHEYKERSGINPNALASAFDKLMKDDYDNWLKYKFQINSNVQISISKINSDIEFWSLVFEIYLLFLASFILFQKQFTPPECRNEILALNPALPKFHFGTPEDCQLKNEGRLIFYS